MIVGKMLKTGHVDLHYAEAAGPGPPLVLLHGITGSLETYEPLMPELALVAHVYALDLRGHGLSDCAASVDDYRVPGFAQDVHDFLQMIVKEPAVVVGHSLGALAASWTAAQDPGAVRGVFLEDPPLYKCLMPAFKDTMFYPYFVALRDLLTQLAESGGSVDDLAAEIASWPVAEDVTLLEQAGEEGVWARALELSRLDVNVLAPTIEGTLWSVPDPDPVLNGIACPVHIVAGLYELGGALDEADLQRAVANIPGCTHTLIDTVGHMIHTDQPRMYVRELMGFLERLQ
jgi:pimeloyl-ACP methyl ester carboxylesterase